MTPSKMFALTLLSLAAVYGCTASDAGDEPPGDATNASEDQLGLRRGSVDNVAIVEVTTMMLVTGPTDFASVLDPYNQEDPFAVRGRAYQQPFAQNLVKFDAEDGKTDWTAEQSQRWVARVAARNFVVVDTSKPCNFASPHTYLEIERAQMTGVPHATCGGRMPNEDAMDVTLNWLIRGPAASAEDAEAIHDGVEHATAQATDSFPYLAELNGL